MQATALSPRSLRLPSRLLRAAPDERLVTALRRGDESAFEAIYDRHHIALLGFCRHMLGSHEEAEDALQRVFVSAHRHLAAGSAHVNLRPWLYTIARNRCLSMLRARRETLALDDVREPSTDGLALADEVELGEDLKDLLGDMARLPDDQRAALVLAELGDLTQREIAATLDVQPDKVKALIFQAREALAGWREARAVSCHAICEQLSTLKGSALRRAPIRRHLALCPSCAAFEAEVKHQRAALALLLPVVPSVALKHSVLAAALSASTPGAVARAERPPPACRGSAPRRSWSPRSRSAQVAAAWWPCTSSNRRVRSSARRRRRHGPAPRWRQPRRAALRFLRPPPTAPRRPRRRGGSAPARMPRRPRHTPAAGGGPRRAGSGRQHAVPARPAGSGRRQRSPSRSSARPRPHRTRRPRAPRRASAGPRRRPPRTASSADPPTSSPAVRLRRHEDPHRTLADRRTRPQHHRIRGGLDPEPCPFGIQAVPHRAVSDGPRALPHDLRHEQDQAQRVRQVRLHAVARDH